MKHFHLAFLFLLAAMTIGPACGQRAPKEAAPASSNANKPSLVDQIADYSKEHRVIVIGVSIGQEDKITGEEVGETLSAVMKKDFDAPVKYFIAPGGKHTAIVYAVKGHLFDPVGLKQALDMMALVAHTYASAFAH